MNGLGKVLLVSLLLLLLGAAPAAAQETTPALAATLPPPSQAMLDATPAPIIRRDYMVGDSGSDVYSFKRRLQYLGYFKADATLSDKISGITLERVNLLLQDNGLEPVETITTDVQAMIFENDGLAIVPTPTPKPTTKPLIAPAGTPALPALDGEGFLQEADGEFVFEDDGDGLWYYISDDLYINIRRYDDQQEQNIWYEAEIKTRGEERLLSMLADPVTICRSPVDIARAYGAVLAFTDEFYTRRKYGVVIRDGEILRDTIRRSSTSFPLGDEMAVFADGSMRAYEFDAYTAEEYLAMGAVHVISFGPWLIRGGVINPRVLTGTYMHYHEPRCALGMIEPGHYVVLTVDGRYDGARGCYFSWLATRMHAIGVTEAINLDGGGTTAMVFMGTQISRVSSVKSDGSNSRRVCGMLGFGVR